MADPADAHTPPPTPPPTPRPAPPRSRLQRPLVGLMLVVAIVVIAFLGWRTIDAGLDLRGDSVLVIERGGDVEGAYVLNITRTQEELPTFATLLDEAYVGGKATTNDPELVGRIRAYMDRLAHEEGHESFSQPPFENTLRWGAEGEEKTLRLTYVER